MMNHGNFTSTVTCMAKDAVGNLYVGGDFIIPGTGSVESCNVAKWDGKRWTRLLALPGDKDQVDALACDSAGNLYIGGSFMEVNGVATRNVAKWDGARWSALGRGVSGKGSAALDLAFDAQGRLFVGGKFSVALDASGEVAANNIAVWDGAQWSALASEIMEDGIVFALKFDSVGNLFAGGHFNKAGGAEVNHIAKWDGTKWSALGTGMTWSDESQVVVFALETDSAGRLHAGGRFETAGDVEARYVAAWDGAKWSALGSGAGGVVGSLAVASGDLLLVGGSFLTAGGVPAVNLAIWDGSGWRATNPGINGPCQASAKDAAGNFYFGGGFTSVNGLTVNHVAKWDGSRWSALGSGMNAGVWALACDAKGNLYAGGTFTEAEGARRRVSPYGTGRNGRPSAAGCPARTNPCTPWFSTPLATSTPGADSKRRAASRR